MLGWSCRALAAGHPTAASAVPAESLCQLSSRSPSAPSPDCPEPAPAAQPQVGAEDNGPWGDSQPVESGLRSQGQQKTRTGLVPASLARPDPSELPPQPERWWRRRFASLPLGDGQETRQRPAELRLKHGQNRGFPLGTAGDPRAGQSRSSTRSSSPGTCPASTLSQGWKQTPNVHVKVLISPDSEQPLISPAVVSQSGDQSECSWLPDVACRPRAGSGTPRHGPRAPAQLDRTDRALSSPRLRLRLHQCR